MLVPLLAFTITQGIGLEENTCMVAHCCQSKNKSEKGKQNGKTCFFTKTKQDKTKQCKKVN